jgi:integrase
MSISLAQLSREYLDERAVNGVYGGNIQRIAGRVGELSVEACNRYLKKRLTEVSSVTVHWERAVLWQMWRYAYDRRLVEALPRGVVKIKAVRRPVRAWTLDQCCTAVNASFQYDVVRLRTGVYLGKFLRCWLLLGYESGARRSDLWHMRDSDFVGDTLYWSQHKTGEPVPKVLSPECMQAVQEMLAVSPDGRVLGWAMHMQSGCKRMKCFLKSLKLSGSSKWLRRSACTHVEIEQPGKGRVFLGHKTFGLAEKNYIDWAQVRRDIPQAPRLLKQT